MSGYDPQRRHRRPTPPRSGEAPVDALLASVPVLDGADRADSAGEEAAAVGSPLMMMERGPSIVPERRVGIRKVALVALGALVVIAILRRRR